MISFIIPAHNEQTLIGATLAALRESADQVDEPYEVIVVADACTDATADIAREAGARVVQVAHRQIAATRNAGAREAQGDVYFFVDADTLANAGAVRSALYALRSGAAGGGCIPRFDGRLPVWARLLSLLVVAAGRTFNLVGGCFLFCTREAFESVGGFCEEYYAAEEAAFIRALKQYGRFVVPRDRVVTSGRKLRTHSAWEIGRQLWRLAWRGPKSFRSRDGLEVWYGEPRVDPECIGPAHAATVKACMQRRIVNRHWLWLLVILLWPVPAAAQPLFETEHDWRITIGEHSYGLWQVVQQPGEFRQTTIWCGPWVFHTRLRAAEVAAIAIGPLVLGFAVAMSRWRRKGDAAPGQAFQ